MEKLAPTPTMLSTTAMEPTSTCRSTPLYLLRKSKSHLHYSKSTAPLSKWSYRLMLLFQKLTKAACVRAIFHVSNKWILYAPNGAVSSTLYRLSDICLASAVVSYAKHVSDLDISCTRDLQLSTVIATERWRHGHVVAVECRQLELDTNRHRPISDTHPATSVSFTSYFKHDNCMRSRNEPVLVLRFSHL
jgi:hypothetical protein